ncbi:MAG: polyprenol monophosphomannose synthase [Promethearchaeota archaeon]
MQGKKIHMRTSSPQKEISIVIPTYNEIDNIQLMISNIQHVLESIYATYEILVVDDNSPDGTGEIVENISNNNENVKLIQRSTRTGLGDAYKLGFQHTIGDIIFEIDADLSHDPNDIPKFLKSLEKMDVIVGSRYVKGGGNYNRRKLRIIISRIANILASFFFNLHLSDCTSGYRAYKREVIDTIIPYVNCQKYTFQVEMLEKANHFGFSIGEIPIKFRDRHKGKSKFNFSEIKEFLKELIKRVLLINRIKKKR